MKRDLLRRAWPKGYLAARGARTVGGWTCMGLVENEHKFWMRADFWVAPDMISLYGRCRDDGEILGYGNASPLNVSPWTTARKAGDLLPSVDPADRATWACLLADLAAAAGVPERPLQIPGLYQYKDGWGLNVTWQGDKGPEQLGMMVLLPWGTYRFAADTDDPTLALVLARIQLREAADGE